jgi:transcriptional regulator with XRE-family HTH domain
MLNWSVRDLAEHTEVHRNTISAIESGKTKPNSATVQVLRTALEAAGVVFVDENGHGPGVRLRKAAPAPSDAVRTAQGVFDARGLAEHAIDKALENSGEPGHVKDKRRRSLTELPNHVDKGKPAK